MKSMNQKKLSKIILITLSLFLLYILASLWLSTNHLSIHSYNFPTAKTDQQVTLAVISDLHGHEFGRDNEALAERIKGQSPDLILMDGDFLNADSDNADIPCDLIRRLIKTAPVYYALGNHELSYIENGHPELVDELQESGAVVLDKEYVDLEVRGTAIRLGGMYDYAFGLDGSNSAAAAPEDVKTFMEDFQDTERLKIMMSHRPDSFIFGDASSYWDVDLVISGHDHGGQVVIPFLGGIYGGDQGWFPEYVHGMYQKDEMHLFVTSGLGSHDQMLKRFNNFPEIAIIKIEPLSTE